MAYATPAQFLERKDARVVGDLVSDTGIRVLPATLLTNDNLQAALDDASGEIEAALLQGKRYTTTQLSALTGNSAKHLVRLTCDIAFGLLWERGYDRDPEHRAEAMERSRKALELLRTGQQIFDIDAAKEASVPDITGPTRVRLNQLNTTAGRGGHMYPHFTLPDNR